MDEYLQNTTHEHKYTNNLASFKKNMIANIKANLIILVNQKLLGKN